MYKQLHECKQQWIESNSQSNKAIDHETSEVDLLKGTTFETFTLPDGTVIKQGSYVLEWDTLEEMLFDLGILKRKEDDPYGRYREVN